MLRAVRRLTIMGKSYAPGDEVPMALCPPHTRASLLHLRRLEEVPDIEPASQATPAASPPARKRQRVAAGG